MSSRGLWALSVPLALAGWIGLILLTGVLSVSTVALVVVLPVLALALTMTVAPAIWVAASRLGYAGHGRASRRRAPGRFLVRPMGDDLHRPARDRQLSAG